MFWLTDELHLMSTTSPAALLSNLRAHTSRYWSHNHYGDTVVGLFVGSRVLVWRSKRGFLFAFPPRPFFLGTVRAEGSGASLLGRFSGPVLEPLSLLPLSVGLAVGWALVGLAAALSMLLLFFAVFWLAGRRGAARYLDSDRPVVEALLREAVAVTPAA